MKFQKFRNTLPVIINASFKNLIQVELGSAFAACNLDPDPKKNCRKTINFNVPVLNSLNSLSSTWWKEK